MPLNIWIAAADNQWNVVEDCLNSGLTPNTKDPNGYTPIHAAAAYGHKDLLKKLITKGGDINIKDNDGDTPLHHCEDVETAKFIVEELHGDWTVQNNESQTALDSKEEDDEFPDLIQYLTSLKASGPIPNTSADDQGSLLTSLPSSGDVQGHNIRYMLQDEEQGEVDQKRRRQIEAIIHGDNPQEALRDLITNAVHDGMLEYQLNKRVKDTDN